MFMIYVLFRMTKKVMKHLEYRHTCLFRHNLSSQVGTTYSMPARARFNGLRKASVRHIQVKHEKDKVDFRWDEIRLINAGELFSKRPDILEASDLSSAPPPAPLINTSQQTRPFNSRVSGGKGGPGFFLPAGLIGVTDAPKWRLIGVSAHLGPQFLDPSPGPLSNTGLEDANLSAFRKVGSARNRTIRNLTTLKGHNAWLKKPLTFFDMSMGQRTIHCQTIRGCW